MNPKVAIVIVTWNKKNYVLNLLNSLQNIKYDNYDIIVVDNASNDGSVEAIKCLFPSIQIIANPVNLGGSGGFNTGIKAALKKDNYKYIWLLDNDAEVVINTLYELIEAMEHYKEIGIAGSRIMSPENKSLIVELGSFVDWKSVTWSPNLRYIHEKNYTGSNVSFVDYVPFCSALVRKEVFDKIGLIDENYFLHWDDIDFCLRAKKNNFKVAAIFSSIVYHGVEKGFNPLMLYYDFRNGLLAITKHLNGYKKYLSFINVLRLSIKTFFFFLLENNFSISKLVYFALSDFCLLKFGKCRINIKTNYYAGNNLVDEKLIKNSNKILIFSEGSYYEVKDIIKMVNKMSPTAHISLLVQRNRKNIFNDLPIHKYFTIDTYTDSNLTKTKLLFKILFSGLELGISSSNEFHHPFVYCIRKNIFYNRTEQKFYSSNKNILKLWKIILSNLMGEIVGIMLSPFFYTCSLRFKFKKYFQNKTELSNI